jgi:glycosyltransferase involved in cell wall biosynthesis
MPAPLLLDLSHTSHTRARTGIQRVTRSLRTALGERAVGITHDPHLRAWRALEAWENANLTATGAATKRGARWPIAARVRGRLRRFLGQATSLPPNAGVLVPEIFSPAVARALPSLFEAVRGPRIAVFHDAIALQFPELTPPGTVGRFPAYLVELLAFDGIAAVSEASAAALTDYWRWLGAPQPPPVRALPLGVDLPSSPPAGSMTPTDSDVRVLSVGSIEGRKNHLALLDACEALWAGGARFSLQLIGLAHAQTGAAALNRIRSLQSAGRPLHYGGPAGDAEVAAAYAACSFTVYPSQCEGFGLPVLESLVHGKPCVCSARGALGESARGGGCVALDSVEASTLAATIGRLVAAPAERAALAAAARQRRFRTWTEYANDLEGWAGELAREGRTVR